MKKWEKDEGMKHRCQLSIITVTLLDKCNNPPEPAPANGDNTGKWAATVCFQDEYTSQQRAQSLDLNRGQLRSGASVWGCFPEYFCLFSKLYWTESFRKLPNFPINRVCKQTSWKEVSAAEQSKWKSSSFICVAVVCSLLTSLSQPAAAF